MNLDRAIRPTADDAALQRCTLAIQQRRPDEAERIARDVLARSAQHPGALFYLGVALLAQRRPTEAVAPLEAATRVRPDVAIETHLALALRNSGKLDAALPWFERATARQPAFAPAFLEFGITLRTLRRFADAAVVLKRGLQAAPGMAEMEMVLGAVLLDLADPAGARAAFARALASRPGHPEALFGLGTAMLNEGDFAGGAERFRQILAQIPTHVRARLNLAYALMELGQWDEAVASLRAVLQIDQKSRGNVIRMLVASGRGRFWLKRSDALKFLGVADKL
jgi:tetratricopeptide (TPR) repeat protein